MAERDPTKRSEVGEDLIRSIFGRAIRLPKIRFINLLHSGNGEHILKRVAQRGNPLDDLQRLRSWVVTEPQTPEGGLGHQDFGSFVLHA